MILDDLPLARLRFDLEALHAAEAPAYKGDLLRMALLWWLAEFWCPLPERCRNGCRRPGECLFGRLCEPAVNPAWSASLLRLMSDTPPPAYALWDCQDRRGRFEAGTTWQFEVTLVGELALGQLPAIVTAVLQGAERGMGRMRLQSRLKQVAALGASGECVLVAEKAFEGGAALAWQRFQPDDVRIDYRHACAWAGRLEQPLRSLSLRYLSPIKIKERGEWVEQPRFSAVMRAVVRRLRILSEMHGAGEWPQAEYGPLLDLADTVRLEHHETLWNKYARHSKRSGEYDVEGFVGQAWYAGDDLRPLLPALWLGQWLHIGKGYVMGNGRYAIAALDQA